MTHSCTALVALVALAACTPATAPGVPMSPNGFAAQNAAFASQANANQQSLYSAIVPKTSAIETVPADRAPTPPGSGWYCYESRITRFTPSSPRGDTKVARPCHRTESACRVDADKAARTKATSDRERVEVSVSTCAPRASASCTYFWFENGSGGHVCVAGKEDCDREMLAVTTPGSAVKQAECRDVK